MLRCRTRVAYHQGLEGGIKPGLETQKLCRFTVVVNQLAEASPMCYQGHPLGYALQGSGKATSDHLSQTEQITLLGIILD